MRTSVLAVNGGSSSIKFAVYRTRARPARVLSGVLDRIGTGRTTLSWRDRHEETPGTEIDAADAAAVEFLIDWIAQRPEFADVGGVGHRVVHGMRHTEPSMITPALVDELREAVPYAPEHMPREIEVIDAFSRRHADLPQVACYDTAFHRDLPSVARLLPIPRRYYAQGVRRYGFHGLSFEYLLEELARVAGADAAHGRVILAHLGHGASLAAVRDGACIDTTMSFTPAAGLVMGTRTGDLDPGLVSFLANAERMTAAQFHQMVNHEAGLLGVSETSSDMRDLLAREADDPRAAEAVALFCYQARKWVGAFAAALGGLDTLVFSAGIGEHSAPVRARTCTELSFLGIELDEALNQRHAPLISTDRSRVAVRVIPTDEELMIARSVARVLGLSSLQNGT